MSFELARTFFRALNLQPVQNKKSPEANIFAVCADWMGLTHHYYRRLCRG